MKYDFLLLFPPTLSPSPLSFCPCALYTCSLTTLPLLSLLFPPTSPLVTVRLFFISLALVLFCLLVCFIDQVPLIGEIIWYLSFITWLTSLSIMFRFGKERLNFHCMISN